MTKLIRNKKFTRITALLLVVAVIFGTMFSLPVSAASGDKVTITFDFCYDSTGNIIKFQQTTVSDGYTVGTPGEELCKIFADGKEAYCIEPGYTLYSGNTLTECASTVWKNLGSTKQKAINLALLYGKPGSGKSLSGTEDQKWIATQLIVWEFVSGCRSTNDGYKCTNTKFIDGICAGGANPGVKSVYNAISKSLANDSIVPSFASAIASKAETYEMKYSDGKYTLTLTDSNSILSDFSFKTTSGVSVSVSGNKLTLISSNPVNDAVTFNSAKSMPSVGNTTLIPYGDATLQDVITGVENDADPIRAYFKVKTSSGNLKLVKTSEDGNVANIEFTVKGDDYSKTVKTNSKGEFELSELFPGKYTVTEHTPTEYAEQKSKTVNVESGKTATVSFSNVLKKWNLTVTKTDAETKSAQGDASLAGAVYGIYNNGKLVDKYTTDKNGSFTTSYISSTWTYNGKTINWIAPEHCLLLVGYDSSHYIFNDPLTYQPQTYYSKSSVEVAYKGLNYQAIVLEKKDTSTPAPTPAPVYKYGAVKNPINGKIYPIEYYENGKSYYKEEHINEEKTTRLVKNSFDVAKFISGLAFDDSLVDKMDKAPLIGSIYGIVIGGITSFSESWESLYIDVKYYKAKSSGRRWANIECGESKYCNFFNNLLSLKNQSMRALYGRWSGANMYSAQVWESTVNDFAKGQYAKFKGIIPNNSYNYDIIFTFDERRKEDKYVSQIFCGKDGKMYEYATIYDSEKIEIVVKNFWGTEVDRINIMPQINPVSELPQDKAALFEFVKA